MYTAKAQIIGGGRKVDTPHRCTRLRPEYKFQFSVGKTRVTQEFKPSGEQGNIKPTRTGMAKPSGKSPRPLDFTEQQRQ